MTLAEKTISSAQERPYKTSQIPALSPLTPHPFHTVPTTPTTPHPPHHTYSPPLLLPPHFLQHPVPKILTGPGMSTNPKQNATENKIGTAPKANRTGKPARLAKLSPLDQITVPGRRTIKASQTWWPMIVNTSCSRGLGWCGV